MTDVLDAPALKPSAVVDTTNGPVRGYLDGGIEVFKGLRYGAPPVGRRRFRPPEPPGPWREVADAVTLGARLSSRRFHPAN